MDTSVPLPVPLDHDSAMKSLQKDIDKSENERQEIEKQQQAIDDLMNLSKQLDSQYAPQTQSHQFMLEENQPVEIAQGITLTSNSLGSSAMPVQVITTSQLPTNPKQMLTARSLTPSAVGGKDLIAQYKTVLNDKTKQIQDLESQLNAL